METLVDLLRESAEKYGQRTATSIKLRFRTERWTYARLQEQADSVAANLSRLCIGKGDRVVICAPNQPAWVGAFFGCMKLGVVAVPLDIQSTPNFLSGVLAATEPRLILGDESLEFIAQQHDLLPI